LQKKNPAALKGIAARDARGRVVCLMVLSHLVFDTFESPPPVRKRVTKERLDKSGTYDSIDRVGAHERLDAVERRLDATGATSENDRLDLLEKLVQEQANHIVKLQNFTRIHDEAPMEVDADIDDVEAFEPPQSLAAFCIEEAMAPLGPTWNGVVATLQMVLLTFFQYILAHTFFDTAWLQYTLYNTQTDFYVEWPDPHEFYIMRPCPECRVPSGLDRTFEFGCDGPDGRQAGSCRIKSRLSVLASAAAIILLVAGPLFMDDCQTTCCKLPIDYLLFDDRLVDFARRQPRWRAFAVLLWRLATVLIFQFCWAVRVLLVPGFCLSGTTMVLNQADSALDVVLNSVAIGFV
jgi:hypothetical protein